LPTAPGCPSLTAARPARVTIQAIRRGSNRQAAGASAESLSGANRLLQFRAGGVRLSEGEPKWIVLNGTPGRILRRRGSQMDQLLNDSPLVFGFFAILLAPMAKREGTR
jgi:hypothetical protein